MKILSIRIKNLASLSGEHFIDFESEPLASAGLIAIVGKTGAGKSTILDAMCLALFNKIPRLKDSDGKLIDADGSELLSHSPLTVLRRGTAHGYAELCFVAQNQKTYLARWELKRSREKADGKLQSVQRYLKCLSDGVVIADKTKAVDTSIHQITQLSFEQFTRAVLLAQSEVTAFLKARDNERGELLEYLTNSEIFTKVGQLAFEKTKLIASKRKELENLIGHIELLSDEQVAELSTQLEQVNVKYKTLETEKNQLEQQQRWFERKQQLDSEIVFKQQLVDTQLKIQQDLTPEKQQLNRLEIFSSIRPTVIQQQQHTKTEQQLAPLVQKQQQVFNELQIQFEAENTLFSQAEATILKQQTFENTHREALSEVRKCIQEREFIGGEYKKLSAKLAEWEAFKKPLTDQIKTLEQQCVNTQQQQNMLQQQLLKTQQFSSLDKGLTVHILQLQKFIQQYQNVEQQLGNQIQAEQKLNEQKNQLQQQLTQFGQIEQLEAQIEQTHQQRELKINQLNQLNFLQQRLLQYFELDQESQQFNVKLQKTTEQIQSLENSTRQAEQELKTIQTERENLQHILQQQRLLHTENIEHLRAELQDGKPCLVCGSTSHPYRTDQEAVSKVLFELHQQQEQQAIVKEQQASITLQTLQLNLAKSNTESEQLKAHISVLDSRLTSLSTALNEQAATMQIQLDLSQTQDEISTQLTQGIQQSHTEITQIEAQSGLWFESLKTQKHLIQQIQQTERLLETAQSLHHQVQHITECLTPEQHMIWQQQSIMLANTIYQQLHSRSQHLEQFEQLNKQLDLQNQQLNALHLKVENSTQQITELTQNLHDIKLKGQQNTELACQLIQQMTGVNETKPNEWLVEYDETRQNSQVHYQQCKLSFDRIRHHFEQQRNELEKLNVQHQQNQQSIHQTHIEIQDWLTQHADFQPQELNTLIDITPTQIQKIRQQLQQAERLFNEANAALKTIQEQELEHRRLQPEISETQLQQCIIVNAESRQSQAEIRDQLKLQLELHQQNLTKQKQFADQIAEIQQEEHRWSKISSLMGDKEGKKFRDYAQQYNLDILLEYANQQLSMLSQRYTLKRLENSLSLAIIDHDMDGETRAVASLSGGESFLTALALSLAIANMASGHTKIESLFIDEGFGTLDASSLHMVMNALDQLQNQGRKVVLISHIQEMHERIPVQIQVIPVGAGASTIEVVG